MTGDGSPKPVPFDRFVATHLPSPGGGASLDAGDSTVGQVVLGYRVPG